MTDDLLQPEPAKRENVPVPPQSPPVGPPDDPQFRVLLEKSPTLQADLDRIQSEGFDIRWGPSGRGTFLTEKGAERGIVIDENARGKGAQIAGALAHEIGHKEFHSPLNRSSKEAYVTSLLRDEAAATIHNARVRQEILSNGGPDIGFAGQNAQQYRAITDQMLAGKTTEAHALDQISEVYKTERTSNTRETYEDYYGKSYRRQTPMPEQKPSFQHPQSPAAYGAPEPTSSDDRALLENFRSQIRELDRQAGKTWDDSSERISASALVMAKKMGFSSEEKLHLAFNQATERHVAGEILHLARTGPDTSVDPAANRTWMTTSEALSKPVEERYQQVQNISQQQDLDRQQAQVRAANNPSHDGPSMRM